MFSIHYFISVHRFAKCIDYPQRCDPFYITLLFVYNAPINHNFFSS